MIKFIKRFLIFVIILLTLLVIFAFSFINSIEYSVSSDDLPQNVYNTSGSLLPYAQTKIVELIIADEDERYTITEELINLILLDSIKENVNSEYDPLNDCTDFSCSRIINQDYIYIDYVFAEINEDNQLVVTISAGMNKIIAKTTALIMVFDIEFDMNLDMEIKFTLDEYYLGEKAMSMTILNYIFNRLDKTTVENSMTLGTLNLDDYTYTISLINDIL